MNETVCSGCGTHGKSQWRIDLEAERGEATERTEYPLCRDCWTELTDRFAGPIPGGS